MCWYGFQCCCSRDCALFCCQTPERQRYFNGKKFAYDGKLHMSSRDKATYSELLKNDIVFLKNHEVMDYSLLIGIQEFNSIEVLLSPLGYKLFSYSSSKEPHARTRIILDLAMHSSSHIFRMIINQNILGKFT
mmetsp:Transcript_18849/g.30611  ORF Transcript_18849/g.30611 Transcript_18849/m.30611 type:complete len:133 (+) Transcript_18849:304-702(+)